MWHSKSIFDINKLEKLSVFDIFVKRALVAFSALFLGVTSASVQAEMSTSWPQHIEFTGNLAIEALAYDGYRSTNDIEDVRVDTLELALGVALSERLMAEVAFLYEEDDTPFDVDIAVLHLALNEALAFSAGQVYIPFGRYQTALVNDPLTLEIGEGVETVVMGEYNLGNVVLTGYLFNGEVQELSDTGNNMNSFGFRLTGDVGAMTWGVDFVNNLADSDGLSALLGNNVSDLASALSIYGSVDLGGIFLHGEYLTALDEVDGTNEPSALHVEASFSAAGEATIVGAIQRTDDVAGWLPETRISLGYRTDLDDIVNLGAELFIDEDYDTPVGTDESAVGVVVNVAVAF